MTSGIIDQVISRDRLGVVALPTPGQHPTRARSSAVTYLDSILDLLFWSKVQKSDWCWEWRGHLNTPGYGYFLCRAQVIPAHRFSWELANQSAIPDGLSVCHKCDNPKCVRPEHLFIGTHKENMLDMCRKGRASGRRKRTDPRREGFCLHGHELTEANTYTNPKGGRICRVCISRNKEQYKARHSLKKRR